MEMIMVPMFLKSLANFTKTFREASVIVLNKW